jgi:hypothetical protein
MEDRRFVGWLASKELERVMNFKPDIEWFPMPEVSRKLAGGANHRIGMEKLRRAPLGGRRNRIARFLPPLPGLVLLLAENRWLAPPANFLYPSGTTLPSALKAHDTL